jgi:hypothetical protein
MWIQLPDIFFIPNESLRSYSLIGVKYLRFYSE